VDLQGTGLAAPAAAGVLARLEVALDVLADEVGDVGAFGRRFGVVHVFRMRLRLKTPQKQLFCPIAGW
jgi:hypothetical protein